MKLDLHIHSLYSDGIFTPEKIIELAIEKKLDGISITDHDTISGIEEALNYKKKHPDFKVIPGIELSCLHNENEVHILGYAIDYKSKKLHDKLEILKNSRIKRSQEIVGKLNHLGLKINFDDIKALGKNDFIGRVHIAKILIENKYVSNIQEAFNKYLNLGKPAYIPRDSFTIGDSIKLIKDIGGIPILAHPGLLKDKSIINYCIQEGIMGIECIHSKHSLADTKGFIAFTKNKNLIITGGSDCHGQLIKGDLLLGQYYCNVRNGDDLNEYI